MSTSRCTVFTSKFWSAKPCFTIKIIHIIYCIHVLYTCTDTSIQQQQVRLEACYVALVVRAVRLPVTAWSVLGGLGSERGALAGDGLEARLDAGHGAARAARFALQEVEASVALQDRLRRLARVTRHVLLYKHTRDRTRSISNSTTNGCIKQHY